MSNKYIMTPALRYWGFEKSPFEDATLQNETMDLFVGRERELNAVHNSLNSRLTGVYGTQGVGKSSFLIKLCGKIRKNTPVIYVRTGLSEKTIYREILEELLENIKSKSLKTEGYKLDVKLELKRLRASISRTRSSEIGGKAVIYGKIEEQSTENLEPHTEQSASKLLREVLEHLKTSLAIVIDDLERLSTAFDSDSKYLKFIFGFARHVGDFFNLPGIPFIVSLDDRVIEEASKRTGDSENTLSLSFGRLKRLSNFSPKELVLFIKKRLEYAGTEKEKPVGDFIEEDAFLALIGGTQGHPRLTLRVLQTAIEFVEFKKLSKCLTKKAILEGLKENNLSIDDTDMKIVSHLAQSGSLSLADEKFIKDVFGISSEAIRIRLKKLKKNIGLKVKKEPAGKTSSKDVYELPYYNLNV